MNVERILYLACIAILLFIIGIFYGSDGHPFNKRVTEPTIDLSGGSYLRFVFIGSSTCPFSNNDDTHKMVTYI